MQLAMIPSEKRMREWALLTKLKRTALQQGRLMLSQGASIR
jgi:hypothetical protein